VADTGPEEDPREPREITERYGTTIGAKTKEHVPVTGITPVVWQRVDRLIGETIESLAYCIDVSLPWIYGNHKPRPFIPDEAWVGNTLQSAPFYPVGVGARPRKANLSVSVVVNFRHA